MLTQTLEMKPWVEHTHKWCKRFKEGWPSVDNERSGHRSTS